MYFSEKFHIIRSNGNHHVWDLIDCTLSLPPENTWCFQGLEKGCIGNKQVNNNIYFWNAGNILETASSTLRKVPNIKGFLWAFWFLDLMYQLLVSFLCEPKWFARINTWRNTFFWKLKWFFPKANSYYNLQFICRCSITAILFTCYILFRK